MLLLHISIKAKLMPTKNYLYAATVLPLADFHMVLKKQRQATATNRGRMIATPICASCNK